MSFTDRLSGALDKIADAHAAEVSALRTRLSATKRIVDALPSCYPDGTAILSPEQWLTWATGKLGYAAGVAGTPAPSREDLVKLLDEVRQCFTRDDDLPGDLLTRIDTAVDGAVVGDGTGEALPPVSNEEREAPGIPGVSGPGDQTFSQQTPMGKSKP